eukprot:2097217-Rhodomonas_salina.1
MAKSGGLIPRHSSRLVSPALTPPLSTSSGLDIDKRMHALTTPRQTHRWAGYRCREHRGRERKRVWT